MADANTNEDASEEWNYLASSYHDVFLPRFQPLYDAMANVAMHQIQSDSARDLWQLLDYGTGPGEPILTICQKLADKCLNNVELNASDFSSGMLQVAENRWQTMHKQLPVHFINADISSIVNTYDIITCSLVLPYASNHTSLLRNFYRRLKPSGMLISSHWPHPSQVPFLTIIKRIGCYMSHEPILESDLETDGSFSCWREQTTKDAFNVSDFTITQWINADLPMRFPNIRTLLSFMRICSWFNDSERYTKAETETMRILRDEWHVQFRSDGSFELPSKAIVVVAFKR